MSDTFSSDAIAAQVLSEKSVVVYSDTKAQLDRNRKALYAALVRAGADRVSCPRSANCVRVGSRSVDFLLTNGYNGRGMSPDVVVLSDSARMQHEQAAIMRAEVM